MGGGTGYGKLSGVSKFLRNLPTQANQGQASVKGESSACSADTVQRLLGHVVTHAPHKQPQAERDVGLY